MKIQASHCKRCSRTIVPPRDICPYCGTAAGEMAREKVGSRGTILSHTTLQQPPEGFTPPLTMALVELDKGAVVLCLAASNDDSGPEIGDSVDIATDSANLFRFRLLH